MDYDSIALGNDGMPLKAIHALRSDKRVGDTTNNNSFVRLPVISRQQQLVEQSLNMLKGESLNKRNAFQQHFRMQPSSNMMSKLSLVSSIRQGARSVLDK